jgi:gliding motility-associated-like protein
MSRIITLCCLILTLYTSVSKGAGITFKENKGQWPNKVGFSADVATGQVFIEEKGLTWRLYKYADLKKAHDTKFLSEKDQKLGDDIVRGHVYKVEFMNAQFKEFSTSKKQAEYYNYFLGNDPSQWASKVKAFSEVVYTDIYKSIDIRFHGERNFEYDLIIKPGGLVSDIKLNYQHVKGTTLVNNKLIVQTSIDDVVENIPEAYQFINGKKIKVECCYVLNKNEVSFKVSSYDPNYELVIDPVVVVSSFSGTESVSYGLGMTPDSYGNMYLYSLDITRKYPITPGAIQTTIYGSWTDVALSKFNATGTAKRFSTYIGGNSQDIVTNCVIQGNELAVFGVTRSDTFPIINSGFQTQFGGLMDYFIIKLDTTGSTLLASTYLGGERYESATNIGYSSAMYSIGYGKGEMIMDTSGNCYVFGSTNSMSYPTTPGAYRMYSDSNGFADLVITKFNKDLSVLLWSTYYGGSLAHAPVNIRLSKTGKLYLGGTTNSRDFPTTPGVVHTTSVSTTDMFAFSLDTISGYPTASTYMGAKGTEALMFDIDQNENAYFAGYCLIAPSSITVTPGAYNSNSGNGVFYKIDGNFTQINSVARFGYGDSYSKIEIDAMNVDSCGYIYFGGFAYPSLPTTSDALKANSSPNGNMYFGVFSPGFTSLKYGSYYGGSAPNNMDHDDGGLNYFDDRGYFYHAVCVENDWPITSNAYSFYNVKDSVGNSSNWSKQSDAFVKIDLQTFVNVTSSLGGQIRSCSPITQTFVASANMDSVTIVPGDGTLGVTTNSLVHTYNSYGTYTALIISENNPNTCNVTDSVKIIVRYGPKPNISLEENSVNCNGQTLILDAGNPGSKYYWNTGEITQTIEPLHTGKYWVYVDNGFCLAKDSTEAVVEDPHDFSTPNAFTPNGDGNNEMFCLKGWDVCNQEFEVMIFNRWGEKVFQSDDPKFCWDGKYKGKLLSSDVYVFHITATYKGDIVRTKKGNITLIR